VECAAQSAAVDFSQLEKTALAEMKQHHVPGLAIAVIRGESVIFAKGLGVASVETGAPVTPDMLFRLGSTTKMFTCAAAISLVEEGKLAVDKPVNRYVKGLNSKVGKLTLHQLMTHTSGLHDESPMFGLHDDTALRDGIMKWNESWFFTEPDKIYSYANPGFWLTGLAIETVDGKFYADSLNERLFKPLGMGRTMLRPILAMTYPLAIGHGVEEGEAKVIRPLGDNAGTWPAGQIFSSANDLSRFVIAFMNDGKLEGKQVLSPSMIKTISTPYADIPGSETRYGYGLQLGTVRGVRLAQHSGSRAGYGSYIRMAPEQRFGVILLMNLTGAALPRTVDKAMELALNLPPREEVKTKAPVDMSREEMGKYVGVYRNGDSREELLIKDGKLVLKRGGRESAVVKLDEQHFKAGSTNGEFVLVFGPNGRAEYIFAGGRALSRQK